MGITVKNDTEHQAFAANTAHAWETVKRFRKCFLEFLTDFKGVFDKFLVFDDGERFEGCTHSKRVAAES